MASPSQDFPPLPNSSVLGLPPSGLSYADNVSSPASKPNTFPVSFFSPGQKKLSFNVNDLCEGKSIWNNALIGYSLGPRPYYERLLKAMQKLWPLKGPMSLLSMADGFFLLKFSTSEDLESILSGGPWFLLGKPFILQRWSPKFKPKRDEAAPIPLWIKIVDFPHALWTTTGISRIASYIGIPVSVDALTANRTRLTFARVCVLISKDSVLLDEIPIEIDGEDLAPKNRGRGSSRHRTSQPRRSPSTKPPTKPPTNSPATNGPPSNSTALPPIPPPKPDAVPRPNTDFVPPPDKPSSLPNLNFPTEVSSSSDIPTPLCLLNTPKLPLVNKFASLQSGDGDLANVVDCLSENDSSTIPTHEKDSPDSFDTSSTSTDKKSIPDKGKSQAKAKPPNGKSAKKAKATKY
ncbi:altered inheritance of mitochondria protein 3-like [Dendrobium catenatum]|uniref:altered inheritance of mitochondria protein 3-like n=1 Tax=Dendrobium catenatum TaxID=906689 RepID=UPI0009F4D2A3|nr:altered inheritance of mitochondria protein 3-like [Dendrobium catenatum]